MGCLPSKPDETVHPDIPTSPPTRPFRTMLRNSSQSSSQALSNLSASASASTSRGLGRTSSRRSTSSTPVNLPYDTLSSASLVDTQTGNVAYHGILANTGKLNLNRAPATGAGKIFSRAIHPSHDSNPAAHPSACTRITGIAMCMPYTIIVGAPHSEKVVNDIAGAIFDHTNDFLNGWNPESEIAKLNRTKPGKIVPLSSDLARLFAVVDEMHELTEGHFDPTTGVLTVAFENSIAENGRPPFPSEVEPFKYAIGWRKRLTRDKTTVARNNAHTVVDLDGIAKGYVVDLIVEGLLRQGFHDCYVDWSGDIRVAGNHPSGRPWRSAVAAPPDLKRVFDHWKKGNMSGMLTEGDIGFYANFSFPSYNSSVSGGAIATSGDYFAVQKYGYHHIARADTMTVMKANRNSVGTVCVAARTCAIADAIATAAMTLDNTKEAIEFLIDIRKKRYATVYGFCVIGRTDPLEEQNAFTKSIFVPCFHKQERLAQRSDSAESSDNKPLKASNYTAVIHDNTITNRYRFIFGGSTYEMDNFTPCSMAPLQMVSFIVPEEYIEHASMFEVDEENYFSVEVLSRLSESKPSAVRDTGITANLRFKHISRFGRSALVVGVIEEVNLSMATPVQTVFKDAFMPKKDVSFGVGRSKLRFLALPELTKLFFRQIPSTMWIVSTDPPYGGEVAFTATSIVAPSAYSNVLCFNVSHSSTFFAAFGGIGSTVHAYALSSKQKQFAERHVRTSELDVHHKRELEREAMVIVTCTVEHADSFQDHLIALMRIDACTGTEEFGQRPLVWQNGGFLH